MEEKELSLKDIILYLKQVVSYLLRRTHFIILGGLLIGALFIFLATKKKPVYSEKLTFMMDEKTGNEIPGLDILGDLFGKGGGGGGDNNLGKILELFESKRIIHNTLFQNIIVDGKKQYLANFMLDFYGIDQLIKEHDKFGSLGNWADPLKGKTIKFTRSEIDSFTNEEGLLLKLLFDKINGNSESGLPPQLVSDFNAKSGIMTIRMSSASEKITLEVLNNVYEQLSQFFIDRTIEKQLKTFTIVKAKKDSIEYALKRKEFQLADFKDRNRNLVTVKGYLDQARLDREVQILSIMYAEVIKHLETTDFSLKNKTPVVQIIDKPRTPIIPVRPSPITQGILGFFIGSVIAAALLFLIFQWKKIMA